MQTPWAARASLPPLWALSVRVCPTQALLHLPRWAVTMAWLHLRSQSCHLWTRLVPLPRWHWALPRPRLRQRQSQSPPLLPLSTGSRSVLHMPTVHPLLQGRVLNSRRAATPLQRTTVISPSAVNLLTNSWSGLTAPLSRLDRCFILSVNALPCTLTWVSVFTLPGTARCDTSSFSGAAPALITVSSRLAR